MKIKQIATFLEALDLWLDNPDSVYAMRKDNPLMVKTMSDICIKFIEDYIFFILEDTDGN